MDKDMVAVARLSLIAKTISSEINADMKVCQFVYDSMDTMIPTKNRVARTRILAAAPLKPLSPPTPFNTLNGIAYFTCH